MTGRDPETPKSPTSSRPAKRFVVPKHGHGLLQVGGVNPNMGRPRNTFREALRTVLEDPKTLEKVRQVLQGGKKGKVHSQFASVLKAVDASAYGAPTQEVRVVEKNVVRMDLPKADEDDAGE
jgi:hypothetical protein